MKNKNDYIIIFTFLGVFTLKVCLANAFDLSQSINLDSEKVVFFYLHKVMICKSLLDIETPCTSLRVQG